MRLTNNLRQAFVQAALDDVPTENYGELIRKFTLQAAIDMMPPEVRKAYEKYPDVIRNEYHRFGSGWNNQVAVSLPKNSDTPFDKKVQLEIDRLIKAKEDQEAMLDSLRIKLESVAMSCNTDKQLRELLPEFDKYLPAEIEKTKNLPAIANVVTEFMQAGWPKDVQPA